MSMAMPTFEGFMVPVLTVLSDGEVRTLRALRREVTDLLDLTPDQRAETIPSGEGRADNRISWAASDLTRVGALVRPSRGHYQITDVGRQLLADHPKGLTEAELKPLAKEGDEWWLRKSSTGSTTVETTDDTVLGPVEQIDEGIQRIHRDVAAELLTRLGGEEPTFFESAVVKLLEAMGYGVGTATPLVHDHGIDGVINQDVLGLDKVYIQAKRYGPQNTVQRPEVQAFVGALSGKADGGVFITTSRFSSGAIKYAKTAHTRVILIDGQRLTDLMIDYGVGVQVERTVKIVEVDEDFFT